MTLKSLLPLGLALVAATTACSYATPAPQPAGALSGEDSVRARAGLNGQELRLIPGGLASGAPGLHTNRIFEFGMPRAEVVAAVAAIRGRATGSDANRECGAGPMEFTSFGTLTLNFQNGLFVGWSLDGPPGAQPIEEEYGLGIGTTRADLTDGDRDDADETSTLGVEFDAGGIHGLLGTNAPDAVVPTYGGHQLPVPRTAPGRQRPGSARHAGAPRARGRPGG